jgi:hypothetical protein
LRAEVGHACRRVGVDEQKAHVIRSWMSGETERAKTDDCASKCRRVFLRPEASTYSNASLFCRQWADKLSTIDVVNPLNTLN